MKRLVNLVQRWQRVTSILGLLLAQASIAALLLTAYELCAFALTIRLVGDATSVAALCAALLAGYFVCCSLAWGLALAVATLAARLRLNGVQIVRIGLTALLCAVGLRVLEVWAARFSMDEFPERLAWAMGTAQAAIIAVVALSVELGWQWLTPRVTRIEPLLRGVFWLFVLGACFWLTYISLAAVHLTSVVAPVAVLMVLCSCWFAQSMNPPSSRVRAVLGGLVLLLTLLAPFTAFRNHYARSMTFGHCPVAASLLAPLRNLVDLDDDGAAAPWAGGDDCAEFDGLRGPLELEIPGDGIDQDCRGGDAPLPGPDPAWVNREQLLIELGTCQLPPPPISLVLLTVDALRADMVSPALMPRLVEFAERSLDFRRAYSPSTTTRRALASIFGGKTVSDFRSPNVYRQGDLSMSAAWPTVFAKAGYYTAGYNFLYTLDAVGEAFHHFNRKRGDDLQLDAGKYNVASASMTNAVLSLFEEGVRRPFLIWAHYPDLHAPYLYVTSAPQLNPDLRGYQREVAYTDLHLGRLLRALEVGKVLEHAIVAISADHGEELGQRGIEGHGPFAFDSVIHVPLVLRIPGCPPQQFNHPVSTVDLFSNIAVLVGIKGTARSLGATGERARGVVTEVLHAPHGFLRVVVDAGLKMIVDVRNGGRLLFDLAVDPMESRDLYRSRPDLAQRLERRYQQWLDHPGAR